MKKLLCMLCVLLGLFTAGCGNEFAKKEYEADQKIAAEADRYAKRDSVFNHVDGGYSLTVSKFDGRETLWTLNVEEACEIQISFDFQLTAGKAKIVHVDAAGNVTTLLECEPGSITDGAEEKTVALSEGKNRFKLVGYDCQNVDLLMLSEDIVW